MNILKQLLCLLSPAQRNSSILLLVLMFIGMLLETLGIGLVVPALSLMMQADLIEEYPSLAPFLELLGNPDSKQLITGGVLTLAFVHIFKAGFLIYLTWMQANFIYDLHRDLSQQLFKEYLRRPYTFHLQCNSAQLIRNATIEIGSFTNGITAVSSIITESLVLLGIMVLLLAVQPYGAFLVISTLGLVSCILYYMTKERILRWGVDRQYHEGLRIQHLQQGLSSAKDIKLLGREESFLDQYEEHNRGSANVGRNQNVIQAVPRLSLELLAMIGLAILVLTMLLQNKPMETLIPTLGLFAAAAFRLMPSANRIFTSMQKLRYGLPAINVLYDELCLSNSTDKPNRNAPPLPLRQHLILKHIAYIYPGTDQKVLDDINIQIYSGTTVGFIGSSGSGKSTLIDLIIGLFQPTQGEVKIDCQDIQSNMRGWQNQIGYVPQTIYLTDDTLRRNIAFGLLDNQIDDRAVQAAIKAAQLENFVETLPDGLNSMVGERGIKLSGGQRQRIGIARALYHDPPVLVLDEATSALDSDTEKEVMQAISALQGKKTILIVAHRLSTLTQCDWLYVLENGKIASAGSFDELIATNNSEEVLRKDLKIPLEKPTIENG